jgi:hypothetical protein
LLRELLLAAGIADDVTGIKLDARVSQKSLGCFAEVCQHRASKIQDLFGLYVRKDLSKKAVRQLADILELIGIDLGDVIREKRNGVTTNVYPLDGASWNTVKEIVDRRLSSSAGKSLPSLEFMSDIQWRKRKKKEQEAMQRTRKQNYVPVEY